MTYLKTTIDFPHARVHAWKFYILHKVTTAVADGTYFHTPTTTADGTGGGPIRSGTEIVLNKSTDYLVRLTNTSGSARDMSLEVGFYEL